MVYGSPNVDLLSRADLLKGVVVESNIVRIDHKLVVTTDIVLSLGELGLALLQVDGFLIQICPHLGQEILPSAIPVPVHCAFIHKLAESGRIIDACHTLHPCLAVLYTVEILFKLIVFGLTEEKAGYGHCNKDDSHELG